MMDLLDTLARRVVTADEVRLWDFDASPGEIIAHHEASLAAGAEILRTATLGASRPCMERAGRGEHFHEVNWQAAQLAKGVACGALARIFHTHAPNLANHLAAKRFGLHHRITADTLQSPEPLGNQSITRSSSLECEICGLVAGHVGPLPEPSDAYRDQIGTLLDGGCGLIFLDAFESAEDALPALTAKHELHHCPVIVCLRVNRSGELLSGRSSREAFRMLADEGADVLAVSLDEVTPEIQRLVQSLSSQDLPVGAFVSPSPRPGHFPASCGQLAASGARLLGGGLP